MVIIIAEIGQNMQVPGRELLKLKKSHMAELQCASPLVR